MKFSLAAIALGFAASVAAAPQSGNGDFPVPGDMTVEQAQKTCGSKTSVKCCNKASYSKGDTDASDSGLLGGVLGEVLSSNGAGSKGVGLFDQCSDLNVIGDVLNSKCEANVACCQDSGSETVSFRCSTSRVMYLLMMSTEWQPHRCRHWLCRSRLASLNYRQALFCIVCRYCSVGDGLIAGAVSQW